jgi:peroxiredoxin Q/BCP
MLQELNQAPELDLLISSQTGEKFLKLSDYPDKNLILYFYPKDDTPGCTIEAQNFAKIHAEFEKLNCIIIGISKDSLKSHQKFAQKYCLPFILATDVEGKTCENYGVMVEKSMYGKKYLGIQRSTFFLDKSRKIIKIWPKVSVETHATEVLQFAINNI